MWHEPLLIHAAECIYFSPDNLAKNTVPLILGPLPPPTAATAAATTTTNTTTNTTTITKAVVHLPIRSIAIATFYRNRKSNPTAATQAIPRSRIFSSRKDAREADYDCTECRRNFRVDGIAFETALSCAATSF
jgi:hypothetical protein